MDEAHARALRELLGAQDLAALGTLHGGEPFVSMVPFALLPDATFVLHVSALAAHTKDMLSNPAVSLLVIAPRAPEVPTQAVARVTVQADAARLDEEDPVHAEAKEAYLARFPTSAMTFGLGDFSLFALRPRTARFVGGFAQAKTITADGLRRVLAGAPPLPPPG